VESGGIRGQLLEEKEEQIGERGLPSMEQYEPRVLQVGFKGSAGEKE